MKKLYVYKYSPITLLILLFFSNVYTLGNSIGVNGSDAQALHDLGYAGSGVNVALISERNVRATHLAFNDSNGTHVFNFDYSGSGVDYTDGDVAGHDTWVAGIVASRGWIGHPNDIGAASGCNVYSGRIVDNSGNLSNGITDYVDSALYSLINTYNCRVVLCPLQLNGSANGSSFYTLMFDYYANTYNVVFAIASGNGVSNPTIFGDAYNGITTGALIDQPNDVYLQVGSASNPGPTVDGRKKPEITAPGSSQTTPSIGSDTDYYTTVRDGATSFSIPQTAGVAACLLQYANQSSDSDDSHNEVIKAVIVNSTFPNINDKSGNPTYPADPNNTWQADRGYGRIDAFRAYQVLSSGRIIKSTAVTASKGWGYSTMSNHATDNYIIAGQKNERLLFTVAWNRAVTKNGSIYVDESSPKFNIDVNVADESGNIIYSENNSLDNLKKVELILPADGNYTIMLKNTTSKSRGYGLAFELLQPLTGDFNLDYIVDSTDLGQMASDWLKSDTDSDINDDNIVNWMDFTQFANSWLSIDARYYNP